MGEEVIRFGDYCRQNLIIGKIADKHFLQPRKGNALTLTMKLTS